MGISGDINFELSDMKILSDKGTWFSANVGKDRILPAQNLKIPAQLGFPCAQSVGDGLSLHQLCQSTEHQLVVVGLGRN